MLSKFIASALLVAGLAAPVLAQSGPVVHEIPAGYTLRPDSPSGESGPIYDERGFYAGYFRVVRKVVVAPYVPRQEAQAPAAQEEFSGEGAAGYGGYGYGYSQPVTFQMNGGIGTSPYTGVPGYSPTLPFLKSGQGGSTNINSGSHHSASTHNSSSGLSFGSNHNSSASFSSGPSHSSGSSFSSGSSHSSGSGSSSGHGR